MLALPVDGAVLLAGGLSLWLAELVASVDSQPASAIAALIATTAPIVLVLIHRKVLAMSLSRQAILDADDRRTRTVHVPEWATDGDDEVIVRGLTGKERAAYQAQSMRQVGQSFVPDLSNIQAKLVARTVVGEDGERLFTDSDISGLGEKSGAALERVFEAASELSGLTKEDLEAMKGNSDAAQSGDSTSDSPAILAE